jgi:membrane AbrB-like protein
MLRRPMATSVHGARAADGIDAPARRTAVTLALGAAGAAIAAALGLPAAALVGSAVAVGIAAVWGLPAAVASPVRDVAFAVIGMSIGASVSSEALALLARWPLSLAALVVCLLTTTAACCAYLTRVRGCDHETALLSSTPGALSMAVALAGQGYGDARTVSLAQTVRLMTLTVGLPLLLGGHRAAPAAACMPLSSTVALLVCAVLVGAVLKRLKVPAAALLAGLAAAAAGHLLGLTRGSLPDAAAVPAFVVTGAFVGAGFARVRWRELRGGLRSSLVTVAIASGGSALFALVVARRLDVPFAQAWVAFAPGGAETMTAIAIALGYDQAYISAHHVFRIVLLSALLPLALARVAAPQRAR